MPQRLRAVLRSLISPTLSVATLWGARPRPDVKDIIQRSVAANDKDFEAAPQFNYKEKDYDGKSSKTFQVTMIDGSPYQRLLAVNGKPLGKAQAADELKKEEKETATRHAQTSEQRNRRIAEYTKQRQSDHVMMAQLTQAFNFKFTGERKVKKRDVWALIATPRPGYRPPNRDSEVLPGMQGEMWIDQATYEWVKVTAQVTRPVSIGGFLAQVEPGTRFEIEKVPAAPGIWQVAHFSMQSRAKIFYMINRRSAEEDWYYDFAPADKK
jgi:hypothetical protein